MKKVLITSVQYIHKNVERPFVLINFEGAKNGLGIGRTVEQFLTDLDNSSLFLSNKNPQSKEFRTMLRDLKGATLEGNFHFAPKGTTYVVTEFSQAYKSGQHEAGEVIERTSDSYRVENPENPEKAEFLDFTLSDKTTLRSVVASQMADAMLQSMGMTIDLGFEKPFETKSAKNDSEESEKDSETNKEQVKDILNEDEKSLISESSTQEVDSKKSTKK